MNRRDALIRADQVIEAALAAGDERLDYRSDVNLAFAAESVRSLIADKILMGLAVDAGALIAAAQRNLKGPTRG